MTPVVGRGCGEAAPHLLRVEIHRIPPPEHRSPRPIRLRHVQGDPPRSINNIYHSRQLTLARSIVYIALLLTSNPRSTTRTYAI